MKVSFTRQRKATTFRWCVVYLTAIKNILIGKKLISPSLELIFVPSGSYKGIKAVVPIISGRNETLPFVILDSDNPGNQIVNSLHGSLYRDAKERIIQIGDVVGFDDAEVEDLIPTELIAYVAARVLRGPEPEFDEVAIPSKPIVPQIEDYMSKNSIDLVNWKVELSKQVKTRLHKLPSKIDLQEETLQMWTKFFSNFAN